MPSILAEALKQTFQFEKQLVLTGLFKATQQRRNLIEQMVGRPPEPPSAVLHKGRLKYWYMSGIRERVGGRLKYRWDPRLRNWRDVRTGRIVSKMEVENFLMGLIKRGTMPAIGIYKLVEEQRKERTMPKVRVRNFPYAVKTKDAPCAFCRKMDGMEVDLDDVDSLPPYHPNCRCQIEYMGKVMASDTFWRLWKQATGSEVPEDRVMLKLEK